MEEINRISGQVVDAAYHLHAEIGPGPLESVYERVPAAELHRRGLSVRTQVHGLHFERAFRAEQLLAYLRLLDLRLGLSALCASA